MDIPDTLTCGRPSFSRFWLDRQRILIGAPILGAHLALA
jgi:hypothetical protein